MPLRVLIAPDKFKGTLTAAEAAAAIARGWHTTRPQDRIEVLPISDGGDGFGAVMSERLRARPQWIRTVDAAHRPVTATWWWEAKRKTAIIESANVVGLAMLPRGHFHPFQLDTFGLGAVFRTAQRRGAKQIIVGIGGSATNDGGFGLARALGWKFLDRAGNEIVKWTRLHELAALGAPRQRWQGKIIVAVDVQNHLLGARGATRVYGPQKGLTGEDFIPAENCLRRLAIMMRKKSGPDFSHRPGTGAAGGLGFGLAAFCDAELKPGFELFARYARMSLRLRAADLVITGEGAIDHSTAMGKGVGQLAQLCRARGVPCIGLAGVARPDAKVKRLFTLTPGLTDFVSPTRAIRHPARHLAALAGRTAANWRQT